MRLLRHEAALVVLWVVACLVLGLRAWPAQAQVPPQALIHLPVLIEKQRAIWPDAPQPSFLAAQIEQESCISLKHSKCWNPRAELKTSRENGIGLGQFTRAYKADGSIRFDKISELAAAHASLRGWSWEKRYDAGYQLTAIVEMDRAIFNRIRDAANAYERTAFMLAAYNGGEGHVLQDRMLCRNVPGCDSRRWYGHVERHSVKSRAPMKGYGRSTYEINREYPPAVQVHRRPKYDRFWSSDAR